MKTVTTNNDDGDEGSNSRWHRYDDDDDDDLDDDNDVSHRMKLPRVVIGMEMGAILMVTVMDDDKILLVDNILLYNRPCSKASP